MCKWLWDSLVERILGIYNSRIAIAICAVILNYNCMFPKVNQ